MTITIPDNDARIQYTATAGQTVFPYDFPINAEADLVIIKEGVTLTLTTDYTVSGVGVQAGGNVTLVTGATLNDVVTIYRDEAIARTSNFNVAGDFLAGTLNDQLNSITRWGQQLERDIGRVFQLDPEDSATSVTLPLTADRQGKFLAFDSSGDPIASAGTVGDSPIAVSAFMETMLDDTDAATARNTLGLGTLATQNGTFSGTVSGTNTGDQNLFSTIAVSGQSNVVADSTSDTLTLVAGTNITITTNATTDSITINSTSTSGITIVRNVYTSGATWTKPSGLLYVEVEGLGGGGGGGNVNTTGRAGGGGGAGGYARKLIAAASLGATETVTIGSGGASASAGGNTSFGSHITCNGGSAGSANTASLAAGGAGGTATGGDVNVTGQSGFVGTNVSSITVGGMGASSQLGVGGAQKITDAAGNAASGYGAGGGGTFTNAPNSNAGGAGSDGIVIVTEYRSA